MQGFSNNQGEQRVVAYIQATTQVALNYSSLQKTPLFDEHLQRKILNLITLLVNVFCEYLVSQSYRVRHAAFSAMRLIFEHGLNKKLFGNSNKDAKK